MKTHKIIIVWHVKTSQCKKTATQYPHHQNVWKKSPNRLLEPQGKYILIVYLLFVCFVLLVFCVIITSASVAPFSVGYSKTYIGLEAQFGFTHFNLCINLILKSSKTKYRERKLCEGTSSVLSRKVPHYALDIKHCRMRIWRFGVR